MKFFIMKNMTGTKIEGSMFNVLQFFMLRIERPEAKIIIPPTIESSHKMVSLKKEAEQYFETA